MNFWLASATPRAVAAQSPDSSYIASAQANAVRASATASTTSIDRGHAGEPDEDHVDRGGREADQRSPSARS